MDYDFINQEKKLLTKKNIVTFLILAILMAGIPLGVKLVQEQTLLKSRAVGGGVSFRGTGVTCPPTGECESTEPQVEVVLDSPFGVFLPALSPSPTPSPSPSVSPSPSPSLSPSPSPGI